jgi:hypothetical protein
MPEPKATHAQAQLQLQLYDLRREAKLREARDWFNKNFYADSFDDYARIAAPGTQEGTYAAMVTSYWEQACAMLNRGLLHEQLFFETNGEFFFVWERIKASVPQFRERFHMKLYATNLEKAANRYEKWVERVSPGALKSWREFAKQMRAMAAQGGAAKAAGAR